VVMVGRVAMAGAGRRMCVLYCSEQVHSPHSSLAISQHARGSMRQATYCRSDSHGGGHFGKEWGSRMEPRENGVQCPTCCGIFCGLCLRNGKKNNLDKGIQAIAEKRSSCWSSKPMCLAQRLRSKYAGKEVLRLPSSGCRTLVSSVDQQRPGLEG
jgi:hypothetical protein